MYLPTSDEDRIDDPLSHVIRRSAIHCSYLCLDTPFEKQQQQKKTVVICYGAVVHPTNVRVLLFSVLDMYRNLIFGIFCNVPYFAKIKAKNATQMERNRSLRIIEQRGLRRVCAYAQTPQSFRYPYTKYGCI